MVDSRRTGFPHSKRSFFATVEEAIRTAETLEIELLNHGRTAFGELSAIGRKDALQAIQIMSEFPDATLVDAAQAYVKAAHAALEAASSPLVKDALAVYLEQKRAQLANGTLSSLSLTDLKSKTRHLTVELGEHRLTEITPGIMEEFLASLALAPRTRESVRVKCGQFFNFCVRRKWITSNPVVGLGRKITSKDVEILSVEAARILLESASNSPVAQTILPYLAISLFAGLRPNEAFQLRWEHIHFETGQIEVLGSTSKTRESRFVTLEPILAEWLLPYRQPTGSITRRGTFKRDWLSFRSRCGYNKSNPWPVDILRHTYGSYWLATHQDRAHLAEQMGNSVNIIKRHYRRAIPLSVAESFWQLFPPDTSGRNVLPFEPGRVGAL
jgi:integrase